MDKITYQDQDQYISGFPPATQEKLQALRAFIKELAPEAQECISYNMPAFKYNGAFAYFAGYQKHIGFYPTGSGVAHFLHKLNDFKTSKGAIQFPLNKDLPWELIKEIVLFRKAENEAKPYSKRKS